MLKKKRKMREDMNAVRITEEELGRDTHGVLTKVRQGLEVIVEQNHRPVAVIKAPERMGRKISDILAAMKASGANAVVDEDFARDVEEGIASRSQPWNPPSGSSPRLQCSGESRAGEGHDS